ncbi:FemAB family XrtA/PEP-CTERM system-associated protein [Thiohalophilus sp.]|uniref:FemAB family XrtA/PEP-CTERM system-associated protein n=1 Tax=Thiohalophilus sp. TaxID=3028392 RepID=UPI003A100CD4
MAVDYLDPSRAEEWDAFVMRCPEATFFHRAGWKQVLEGALGHRGYFLYAQRNGRIVGVLPLGHVKTRLFGNALISVPFCVYAGVATEDDDAERALTGAARALAEDLQVDYLELRSRTRRNPDWPCKDDLYVTFRKPIDPDVEQNMQAIPRKQRRMVRQAMQRELQSDIDSNLDRFFPIYADSVRRHGTPVFARRYFEALHRVFGQDCQVLTVTREGRPVSSVMSFYFRDEVLPYYGGGTLEARSVSSFDFMYWDLMRRACEQGYRLFDYGRSKVGTGSYSFKKNWGFTPEPLYYEYHLVRAEQIPDINPLNPKYRLFIETWKRLPTPVANLLGPMVSRGLG